MSVSVETVVLVDESVVVNVATSDSVEAKLVVVVVSVESVVVIVKTSVSVEAVVVVVVV
jgi:hypothetical protein